VEEERSFRSKKDAYFASCFQQWQGFPIDNPRENPKILLHLSVANQTQDDQRCKLEGGNLGSVLREADRSLYPFHTMKAVLSRSKIVYHDLFHDSVTLANFQQGFL
jgi:hypothetical protein